MPHHLHLIIAWRIFCPLIICAALTIHSVREAEASDPLPMVVDARKIELHLSDEETQWLSERGTINIAGPNAFPPFHYYREGQPSGMASDYIRLILELLKVRWKNEPDLPWPEVLEGARLRRIDLIACIARSREREAYLHFTEPYLSFPMVILTHTAAPFIGGLSDLHGKKVTFVKKSAVYDWIQRDRIGVAPIFVDTPLEALENIALGRAAAHIENLAAATYLIQKNGLVNLKVAAPTAYGKYHLYIAVRSDWPQLTAIINKVLAAIPPEQHSVIRNRWLAVSDVSGANRSIILKWVLGIGGLCAVIITLILLWNRRLSREIRERKQVEDSLLESELRFRTLFEQAAVGVAQMETRTGRIVRVNQRFCDIVGYSTADLVQRDLLQIAHPDDLHETRDNFQQMIDGHIHEFVMEKRYIRSDDAIVWVNLTVSPIWEKGRRPDHSIAIIEDITGKKKSEEALEESRRQLATLIGNLPGMAYRCRNASDWRMSFVSEGCEPLTGYQPEELIGSAVIAYADIVHIEDRQMVWARVQSAIKSRQSFELTYRIETAQGEQKWVREIGRAVYNRHSRETALEGFITDISERVVAEAELNQALTQWTATFDAVSAAIWILDKDQRIVRSNKNVAPFSHQPYEELIGKHCWNILHDDHKPSPGCPLPLARKSLQRETMEVETKHGWYEIAVDPILDSEGRYAGAVHIATDINKRKQHELEKEKLYAQLIQSQKMESVGRLAGGVAHDFNNMLSVISGHAEMALGSADPGSSLHQDLKQIVNAAQRSADLTRQLLAFARKQTAIPKILDLNHTVEGTLKMLTRLIGEDIRLHWRPGAHIWPVKIDPAQIDQILANLCVNGRDAIQGVGNITIETRNVILDDVYCADHPGFKPGEYGMLTVNDDGQGIGKEIRDNIFEPFFTTKEAGRGTGLGLATVYGIVKQNNGFINVFSEPERGATFNVFLPRIEERAEELQAPPPVDTDLTGTETLLLVEDEETVLNLAERILANLGYTVYPAQTPAEAIRLARQHPKIHLMITDVVMPEMNGRELKEYISDLIPEMQTLFMSGYTSDVISNHGILEDETYYLAKPFTADALGTKIRQILDQTD